jgi:DNA-binding IclR family transcriptional regulator
MAKENSAGARARDRDSIQVLSRAAAVLRVVANEPEGVGLSEISRRTDLARSTIQRIVRSLEDESFIENGSQRGKYIIGSGLLSLAGFARVDVAQVAQPFLQQLALDVDETVDLSVLRGRFAVFVGHIAGTHRLSALSSIGTEFPLHSTANGKALLAHLDPQERAEVLAATLAGYTPKTIVDHDDLDMEIRQVELNGISFDLEEHTTGVCAIGTGFRDPSGKVFAISIPVPSQRFDVKRRTMVAPLLNCRDQIVSELLKGA